MSPIRPANAPDMPARQDPPSLPLPGVALWHPRCGHSPTDEEMNALRAAEYEAYKQWEEARTHAGKLAANWRSLQMTLDRAYERVRADGDEVVRVEVKP